MGKRVTVCVLTTMHRADDVRVTHRIAKSFTDLGYRVIWVGPDRGDLNREYGIEFYCMPFSWSRLSRIYQGRRLYRLAASLPRADVYFAVEPDSAAVAVKLARARRAWAVFDIHEIFHRDMLGRWVPSLLMGLAGAVVRRRMRKLCGHCDLVVGVGVTRIAPYRDVAQRCLIVRHCVPRCFAEGRVARPFRDGAPELTLMHGKALESRGTANVLSAVGRLRDEYGIRTRVVMFREKKGPLAAAAQRMTKLAHELNVADLVDLRPSVSFDEMFPILSQCDAGLVAYARSFGVNTMPNRVFEYMAMGLPVVVPSYSIEMQDLVPRHGCGVLCDMEDPEDLARALASLHKDRRLAREMGANGRRAFEQRLNWETEVQPLLGWIEEVTRGEGRTVNGQ